MGLERHALKFWFVSYLFRSGMVPVLVWANMSKSSWGWQVVKELKVPVTLSEPTSVKHRYSHISTGKQISLSLPISKMLTILWTQGTRLTQTSQSGGQRDWRGRANCSHRGRQAGRRSSADPGTNHRRRPRSQVNQVIFCRLVQDLWIRNTISHRHIGYRHFRGKDYLLAILPLHHEHFQTGLHTSFY